MSYRDILYANYSASFGEGKAFDPAVQFAQYEAVYGRLAMNKDAAVLDVGCGKGEWLAWMKQQGFIQLSGVDGSTSDLSHSQNWLQNVELHQGDAHSFLRSRATVFDLIHGKDVAEHMSKDEFISFLQLAHQALKPGGQLWLMTFNAQAPLASATRYGDFTHEIGLTPRSLAQCLRACGYQHLQVRGVHYCSASLSGRLRWLLSQPVLMAARLMLKLRHGTGTEEGIDTFAPHPDIFCAARKSA
jgi:cyclopropane fatty-acyl-phospholipid synthase-like methyltransferase